MLSPRRSQTASTNQVKTSEHKIEPLSGFRIGKGARVLSESVSIQVNRVYSLHREQAQIKEAEKQEKEDRKAKVGLEPETINHKRLQRGPQTPAHARTPLAHKHTHRHACALSSTHGHGHARTQGRGKAHFQASSHTYSNTHGHASRHANTHASRHSH